MTVEKAELKLEKVQVTIQMKPVVITDFYARPPSKNRVLENFIDCLYHRMFDEKFEIQIKSVE